MAFSAEIMAKLGLDASGFSKTLGQVPAAVGRVAGEANAEFSRKFSFKELGKGILQGIGIGSAQQIAELILTPFRKAAEYAKDFSALVAQVADSNIARMRGELSIQDQLTLAVRDREKLEREIASLAERSTLSEEQSLRLQQAQLDLNRAIAAEKALASRVSDDEVRAAEQQARAFEEQRASWEEWFAARNKAYADELAATDDKKAKEEAVTRALEEQRKKREELVAAIRVENAEIERKLDIETDGMVATANSAASAQGFAAITDQEKAALKAWIAGGKKGPAPITREGNLRDQLSSSALGQSTYLVDGVRVSGSARPRSDFAGASPDALREFIRRQEVTVAQMRSNFATGATAMIDVVSGGIVRNLAIATLQQEIGFARERLRDYERFSGADRRTALRNFEGDPLSFDRLYDSSQANADAAARAARHLSDIYSLLRNRGITVNPPPGG